MGNVRVGIITNGFRNLQQEKNAVCGISPFIDILVISEEAGYQKPDRRIFKKVLGLADARRQRRAMWEIPGMLISYPPPRTV